MEHVEHEMQGISLTSVEMGHLWNTYMIESIVHHMFSYFVNHVEDKNIKNILEIFIEETKDSLGMLESAFKKDCLPVPRGITSEDIIPNAPRLYSDTFYAAYLSNMGQFALASYSLAYMQCSRDDMRKFFKHYVDRLILVNQQVAEVTLAKGIYARPPCIPAPRNADFIKNDNFLNGFLGNKRPLTVFEITNIFYNAQLNALGKALLMGFIQVSKSNEIQRFFIRGKELSNKYFHDFNNVLLNEDISVSSNYDGEVTDSTETPFSDRLMLLHTTLITSSGIAAYGKALSAVQRHDLTALYVKIMAEVGIYSNDGMKLLIQNEWAEQPPLAPDRKAISKSANK